MTEAVSLGELLHEEALFGLTGASERWEYPEEFPSGLCLSAISRVVWAWPDPLPTGLNGDGKNVQTLWWAELDRLHSMTRAHPPLIATMFTQPHHHVHTLYILPPCSHKLYCHHVLYIATLFIHSIYYHHVLYIATMFTHSILSPCSHTL